MKYYRFESEDGCRYYRLNEATNEIYICSAKLPWRKALTPLRTLFSDWRKENTREVTTLEILVVVGSL